MMQQGTSSVSRKARPLRPGATIGIVAPAGPVSESDLAAGIARLHGWGYRTLVGESVLRRRGYLAGSDSERAADFNAVWANPEVDGIICARGGYGTMRILDRIDWEAVAASPKFFCGFSDITTLHAAMAACANLVTFHGPMVAAFGQDETYNGAGLLRAMQTVEPLGRMAWPDEAAERRTIRTGVAEGILAGGNLSLLISLMGTPWEPDFTGRILLLEDVDERPYAMDRMFMQLLLAGKLQRVAGILFGDSASCLAAPEGKPSLTLFEVLEELVAPLGFPVLYGFPAGHTRHRTTLPLGVAVRLDAEAGELTVLEPALIE